MAGKFKYANPEYLTSTVTPEVQTSMVSEPVKKAMDYKYANPSLLGVSLKEKTRTPVMRAVDTVAPTGQPGTLSPINTIDDALSTVSQVKSFQNLIPEIAKQEVLYGKSPEELTQDLLNRDDRGLLSKTFDYITKPFRYETSVFTSPIVAAIQAAQESTSFDDFLSRYSKIAPQLSEEAITGDRELSVYDALRATGLSNWFAVPLGIGADIALSPSTYLGIGGPTKLGRLAEIATKAERAGRSIEEGSKVAERIAKLAGEFGPEASEMLKLAPTKAAQARSGQRALIKFAGRPIVEGAPVFEKASQLRDLTFGSDLLSKAFGTRPASMSSEAWGILKEMDRRRRGAIGLGARSTLKEVGEIGKETNLTPDELSEVFYTLAKGKAPSERLPWEKLTYDELKGSSTLDALRAIHPGLTPEVISLGKEEFKKKAAEFGLKGPMTKGKFSAEGKVYLRLDPEMGAKSWKSFEEGTKAVEEGKNIFSVLPSKSQDQLAKIYGVEKLTPELGEQFGKDWEKFSSGYDSFTSPQFKKWVENFTTKEGGWKKVSGITEITLPSGDVKRIIGDLKFTNEAQESIRIFAKTKFKELLESEKSLGILNEGLDDYVPLIYEFSPKKFTFKRAGKEISTTPFFTKGRKFKNIEEAERFGMEPVENVLELVGIRQMKSTEATSAKKMLDEATELFGIRNAGEKMSNRDWKLLGKAGVDPDNKRAVAEYLSREGYIPMKVGNEEVFFQPEIHTYLNRLAEPFTNEETFRTFLSAYDRAINVWKGYVTSINPKFHARNFISNVFLLYLKDGLRGFDPFVHKSALDILKGKAGEITTDLGQTYSYDDVFKLMQKEGVLGSGFMGGELKSAFRKELQETVKGKPLRVGLDPTSARNFAIEAGRKFGTNVENEAKAVGFLNDFIKTGDSGLAAKRTFEYLYDYMDLTNFEKNVAKRLIPFYTWMSKNIPRMVSTLITEPGKLGAPMAKIPMVFEHKVKGELKDRGIQYPDETVPPFIKEQGAFPLEVDEKGRVKYYNPGLPYMDLARLSIPELASALTPAIKPLSEWIPKGGYSIFMDRPYESYEGQMVEAPLGVGALPEFLQKMLGAREEKMGTYMPGETAAIINTLLPMLRTPQKLLRALKVPSEGEYIYPSELLGQKLIPVDPAIERKATLYDWLRNIEAGKKVERGVERREGRKVVEEMGTPIPMEELLRLHSLKYGPKGILTR